MIGGPKLAPVISPKKTWSGMVIGVTAGVGAAMLFMDIDRKLFPEHQLHLNLSVIVLVAILAQFSDLFVSLFKRKFKIKDSGSLIPGHGGILDRTDSMILTAPLLLYFVL